MRLQIGMSRIRNLTDRKNWLGYTFMNVVNETVLFAKFGKVEIGGLENIPSDRPFILVSNHSSRFDPMVIQHSLRRRTNYMTSPAELTGLQGHVLPWVGAFPADPRVDMKRFIRRQMEKGEGLVIFPEGTVYYDGTTHPFRPGAARLAIAYAQEGLSFSLIPAAITYGADFSQPAIKFGEGVDLSDYVSSGSADGNDAVQMLSSRLHREVCHIRAELGSRLDRSLVQDGPAVRVWVPRVAISPAENLEFHVRN